MIRTPLLACTLACLLLATPPSARSTGSPGAGFHESIQKMTPEQQFRELSRLSVDNWKVAPVSSVIYGEEALEIAQNLQSDRLIAEALNNIGVAHSYATNFGDALDYFFKALVLREQMGDERLVATTLNNIGNVYFISGNSEEAINYYLRSLQIKESSGQQQQLTSTLINLASLYNTLGKQETAMPYIHRAIEKLEAEADSSGLSTAWNNLGRIYMQMGDLDKALEVNIKALEISRRLQQVWDISYISNSVAEIHLLKDNAEEAWRYIRKGEEAALAIHNKDVTLYNLRLRTIYFSQQGQHESFLEAFGRYDSLKDEIFSEENSRAMAEMQVIYKTEQREKENAIQKLQIAKERSLRNSFIFITILVIITIAVLYRRYHLNKKLSIQLERQVQTRTADLVSSHEQINRLNENLLSNTIETEERERRRFSEDLHDGLGPLLSTIGIHLDLMVAKKKNPADLEPLIKTSRELVDEAIQNTKIIANNLTPNILNDFGLQEALEGYVQKINSMGAVRIHLQNKTPNVRYGKAVELAIYRICMELINNSMKHSTAKNIHILLEERGEDLAFRYSDDGTGIDKAEVFTAAHKGLGLSNILSRIKSINGQYSLQTSPGKGFAITIQSRHARAGQFSAAKVTG